MLLLKNLLFTLIAPCSVALWIPYLITRKDTPYSGISLLIAILFFVIGAVFYLWCQWNFAKYGRGTPAPIDAPKKLVIRGLYKYVRNPMYVGMITALLGWLTLYHSWRLVRFTVFIWICFELFIIFYEEPHLRKIFGAEYEEYCAKVGRWFPKLKKT
jgi:protein-S-isoprenylcysteine O-methyltransferase Ste14